MARSGAHAFLHQHCRVLHEQLDSHPLLRSMASMELDVAAYGDALAALQHCVVPAEVAVAAAALGSAWIRQSLQKRHPQLAPDSRQYLQAQQLRARDWPLFTEQLNQALVDPESQQYACMAARNLFRYFCATLAACEKKRQ